MDTVDTISEQAVFAQQLHEHSKKVRESVELIQPLVDALHVGDHPKIQTLHERVSQIRDESNQIMFSLFGQIPDMHLRALDGHAFSQYLVCQQRMADASQDFADLLMLRPTTIASELCPDFQAFVAQVVGVSRQLMNLAETLSSSTDAVSADVEADDTLDAIAAIINGSRRASGLGLKFGQHLHRLETKLDPVTVVFLDRYWVALNELTKGAERIAHLLRLMVR